MIERLVYLDTNVISRIPDLRVSADTAAALAQLMNLGGVRFVTSYKSRAEVLSTQNTTRNAMLQFLVGLIEKTPSRFLEYSGAGGAAPLGVTPIGAGWIDPLLSELRGVFDNDDAEHITHAARANCSFFLTLDESSILSRVNTNDGLLKRVVPGLAFVSPVVLLSVLERERYR